MCIFHNYERQKGEFNTFIYILSTLSRFGYEISLLTTTERYAEQPSAYTSRERFHRRMSYMHSSRNAGSK